MTLSIIIVFVLGYAAIALEHGVRINKAATALLTGVFCWTIYIIGSSDYHHVTSQLIEHVGDFSGIIFFLMGAMTIVELIDMHGGFDVITSRITATRKRSLLWIVGALTFFLSAVFDNLTTTIVMVSLLSKFALEKEERLLFVGLVIIAANAGGAWSPIGDVTTTMLWIDGRITSVHIITQLLLPSLVSAALPMGIATFLIQGNLPDALGKAAKETNIKSMWERNIVLFVGIGALLFVPVFKTLTHLPPFMGMLLALGFVWLVTEMLHVNKSHDDRRRMSAAFALSKIDMPSILFFLGILISISALQATGILGQVSFWLDKNIGNVIIINLAIGLLSAIVDNVPLVAGAMGIYGVDRFGTDHHFWTFLSYCAGTGGSALVIGSAAGVAAMGIAKIDFMWYVRRITPLALAGYFAGAGVYLLQTMLK